MTTTTTPDQATDLEILEALDFDPAIPCRYAGFGFLMPQCRKTADIAFTAARPLCRHFNPIVVFCCWPCWAHLQTICAHCPHCGCQGSSATAFKIVEVLGH